MRPDKVTLALAMLPTPWDYKEPEAADERVDALHAQIRELTEDLNSARRILNTVNEAAGLYKAERDEARQLLMQKESEASAQATMARLEHDGRVAAEMVLAAARTYQQYTVGDASYNRARLNLTMALDAYRIWEAGMGRSSLNCSPSPAIDDYEIQQYMIEGDHGGDKPWAVRDTMMEISMSHHATREEAVEACRKLREGKSA